MVARLRRRGPDYRHILTKPDFHAIQQLFGFRSVTVGSWVKLDEAGRAAEGVFYALMDLLHILAADHLQYGLPSSLISLRSRLALKYGSGGQPGVAAHYEPASRTFALAKNAGPGSLAHEWFHGFDHYLATTTYGVDSTAFSSSCFYRQQVPASSHALVDAWQHCLAMIFDAGAELVSCSLNYDRQLSLNYYRRPEEMAARAFEAFIEDADIDNSYLVTGTRQGIEAAAGVYPLGAQRQRINAAFREYFSQLSYALLRSGE